jgi:hypothetical protein
VYSLVQEVVTAHAINHRSCLIFTDDFCDEVLDILKKAYSDPVTFQTIADLSLTR